jgi:hypothetical protein
VTWVDSTGFIDRENVSWIKDCPLGFALEVMVGDTAFMISGI